MLVVNLGPFAMGSVSLRSAQSPRLGPWAEVSITPPETVNGYYKAELVRGPDHPGPWKTFEELELATLGSFHWHNQERLHGLIGDVPPAEFEEAFYAEHRKAKALAENTTLGSP